MVDNFSNVYNIYIYIYVGQTPLLGLTILLLLLMAHLLCSILIFGTKASKTNRLKRKLGWIYIRFIELLLNLGFTLFAKTTTEPLTSLHMLCTSLNGSEIKELTVLIKLMAPNLI